MSCALQLVEETAAKAGFEAGPNQETQREVTKAQEELRRAAEELNTLKEEARKRLEEVRRAL